jgi:hypothetical protein
VSISAQKRDAASPAPRGFFFCEREWLEFMLWHVFGPEELEG